MHRRGADGARLHVRRLQNLATPNRKPRNGEAPMTQQDDDNAKAFCNQVIERAVEMMAQAKASMELIVDRLLTYAIAQIVTLHGNARAAEILHEIADNVEAGKFRMVTGEGEGGSKH